MRHGGLEGCEPSLGSLGVQMDLLYLVCMSVVAACSAIHTALPACRCWNQVSFFEVLNV